MSHKKDVSKKKRSCFLTLYPGLLPWHSMPPYTGSTQVPPVTGGAPSREEDWTHSQTSRHFNSELTCFLMQVTGLLNIIIFEEKPFSPSSSHCPLPGSPCPWGKSTPAPLSSPLLVGKGPLVVVSMGVSTFCKL